MTTPTFDSEFSTGAKGYAYVPVNPKTGQRNLTYTPTGTPHGGKVIDIKTGLHMNDYTTGLPAYWDPETKQRPKKQSVIVVDTRAGQYPAPPTDQTDDGLRSFFVREGSELNKEIAKALREAPGLTVGSQLYVVWTGERPNQKGGNPAKTFAVKHVPPAAQPADQFFGGQPQPSAPQSAQQSAAVAAPVNWAPPADLAAVQASNPVPDAYAAFLAQQQAAAQPPAPTPAAVPPGVDPAQWAAFQASQQAAQPPAPLTAAQVHPGIDPATGQPYGVPGASPFATGQPGSALQPAAPQPQVPYNPQVGGQPAPAGGGPVDPFAGLG
jgi:hypothetical protein